jgi:hypothetical protein
MIVSCPAFTTSWGTVSCTPVGLGVVDHRDEGVERLRHVGRELQGDEA